jgi:predicted nucleotidyltransferase
VNPKYFVEFIVKTEYTIHGLEAVEMCDKSTLQTVLELTNSKMREIFGEKLCEVTLFGPYARGDYDDESDIDVFAMVDMEAEKLAEYRSAVSGFASDLDLEYDILLSIILQDKATFDEWAHVSPFFINVKKEGVSLYA